MNIFSGLFNSRFHQILELITSFFILNILFVLTCLPIITIFPATAALFGVVREWRRNKDYSAIFNNYFRYFKENFKTSFIIGLIWSLLVILLVLDFWLIQDINSFFRFILYPVFFFLGLLVVFTTPYLFPVMVHFNFNTINVIKKSMLFSLHYLPTTLLLILTVGLCIGLFVVFPISFLGVFSIGSYVIFTICYRSFTKATNKTENS
ncbi:DUF624 domain-containing protein [Halalkalibacter urbisdiaboli]|uniref:YesL family protein n=1 Tax=Halalkalibacter urbisdiaboli TaxID=1960589 RepID=UPI0013FDFD80